MLKVTYQNVQKLWKGDITHCHVTCMSVVDFAHVKADNPPYFYLQSA